jgi:hypothetical protein
VAASCNEEERKYPTEVKWIRATLKKKMLLPEHLSVRKNFHSVEAMESYMSAGVVIIDTRDGHGSGEKADIEFLSPLPSPLNRANVALLKWTKDDIRFNDDVHKLRRARGAIQ